MFKHLPNCLTLLRCCASPLMAWLIIHSNAHPEWATATLLLFIAIALSDWLDGYLARRLKTTSRLGEVLDPIADKLLTASCLMALVMVGRDIFIPALLILLREILITGLRQYIHTNLKVTPLAKYKTWLQYIAIGIGIAYPVLPLSLSWLLQGGFYLACAVTLITGGDYCLKAIAGHKHGKPHK